MFDSTKTQFFLYSIFFFLVFGILGCTPQKSSSDNPHAALSPEEALKHFKLVDKNLEINLVAAEPLVQAPNAISFDPKGRIWAIEMRGYMPDTLGTDEHTNPNGKVVILEDTDGDGTMDKRTVFLDSLILPRAISFVDKGILLAEPPNLWFVENHNDTAGKKQLIDSVYAVGGNPEHKPNTLLRGLDNWIYSAKSAARYRKINGKWVKENTHFRGQWGLTQDDAGRLFYNNNSANILGDYFLPGLGIWNQDQRNVSGFNETIIADKRTYPIHPTPGVNRGYQEGILDDSMRLVEFTAACGPLLYRTDFMGKGYQNNGFVAEPAGNLIKRNIITDSGYIVKGKQAYQGKEFLASDDERFRPVNLYQGPDEAFYVVDMYRGIIQDIAYITPYLKGEVGSRNLSTPLNRGRIYKISPKGKQSALPDLSQKSSEDLVHLLSDKNAWIRETAQRLLVDGNHQEIVPLLKEQLDSGDNHTLGKLHLFWTLEGLNALSDSGIQSFLHSTDLNLKQQAVAAIVTRIDKSNVSKWINEAQKEFQKNKEDQFAPYIGFLLAKAATINFREAQSALVQLALAYANNRFVSDAIISGTDRNQKAFKQLLESHAVDTASFVYKKINKTIENKIKRERDQKRASLVSTKGKNLFETYCGICHGNDGAGTQSLAPPLDGSEWVTGHPDRLLKIILKGVTGTIAVRGKTYDQNNISGEMPAFADNEELSNEDLAQILSYIRDAWSNRAGALNAGDIAKAKKRLKDRKEPFRVDELQ